MKVVKILNNNALLAVDDEENEYVYLANGIGFQNKVDVELKSVKGEKRYKLSTQNDEKVKELAKNIDKLDSKYIEISAYVLSKAQERFDDLDENILLPLADHIAFAIERIQKGMDINNPFATEIQMLFPEEYKVAKLGSDYITERTGVPINIDEISYITLHIHSAISSEHVSLSLQVIESMQEFIREIEQEYEIEISKTSLAYARFNTHMRYMIARIHQGEHLDLDMDSYTKENFPRSYKSAESLIAKIAKFIKCDIDKVEIGYLALHIERITRDKI